MHGTSGAAKNFKKGGGMISTFFPASFFRPNKVEADWKTKKVLEGSRGMLPRKNLHAVMAILVLFE